MKKKIDLNEQTTLYAVQSACYLGRMFLRGEGMPQDFQTARKWFERGAEYGDRECHNGLGIIYRDGLGVKKDEKRSLSSFKAAANQDLAEAQVNLGKYHYCQFRSSFLPRRPLIFQIKTEENSIWPIPISMLQCDTGHPSRRFII